MDNNGLLDTDFGGVSCHVFSPEMPCGAAWLANCFLELNIALLKPWDLTNDGEWSRTGALQYSYSCKSLPWKQNLPALEYNKIFNFQPNHLIKFQHRWPTLTKQTPPIKKIFFVRNPHDALYSGWRRSSYNISDFNFSFEQYVDLKYHHYPLTFKDYLLVYLNFCQNAYNDNSMIVRFEDYKQNAFETLRNVLLFLNIAETDERIQTAVNNSDFSLLKSKEDELSKESAIRKFNYKGQANEFQNSYTDSMKDKVSVTFDNICQWLDYKQISLSSQLPSKNLSHSDIDDFISAMHLKNISQDEKNEIYCVMLSLADKLTYLNI